MAMKLPLVISSILSACFVSSALAGDVCKLSEASALKRVKIRHLPGYFFKVHPEGKLLSYIGPEGNILLDLESAEENPLPGSIDPVWSPDGKLLTVPMFTVGGGYQISFFEGHGAKTLGKSGQGGQLQGAVSPLPGVYQSLGTKGDGVYKIISDHDGVTMMDVHLDSSGLSLKKAPYAPCGKTDIPTDLPMLSKDGRFLSVHDPAAKSTKIYRLGDGKCDLALDLGYGTGKVSFNHDSSQISFHVDNFAEFQQGYFSGISKDKVKNVVVMNLEESGDGKKLTPTSYALASQHVAPGDGGYYPDFDADGNIYFMEDVENHFSFVKTHPSKLEFRNYSPGVFSADGACAQPGQDTVRALNALAQMWDAVCAERTGVELSRASALVSGIEATSCERLVREAWTPAIGVPFAELLRACPQVTSHKPEEIGEWNKKVMLKGKEVLRARCVACHSAPMEIEGQETFEVNTGTSFVSTTRRTRYTLPAFDVDNIDAHLLGEMARAMSPHAPNPMPKGNPLDAAEAQAVGEFFQRRMLEFTEAHQSAGFEEFVVSRYQGELLEAMVEALKVTTLSNDPVVLRRAEVEGRCRYGQSHCEEYFANEKNRARELAQALGEKEREQAVHHHMMKVKCEVLAGGVTVFECRRWKALQTP